jgi:nicotinamide mononucleotide transporter
LTVFQIIEYSAVALSIGFVIFNARGRILSWPMGILGSALYAYVFVEARLYGDMVLQLFYVGMGAFGWWQWSRTLKDTEDFHVNRANSREMLVLLTLGLILIPVFGYLLENYTDSDVPYWDAYTTVFSFIATWMMARRFVQNWMIWIVVDASCVAIYVYKELYATAILFFIYTIMAVYGLYHWTDILKSDEKD